MKVYNHIDEEPMDTKPYRNQGRREDQEIYSMKWTFRCLMLIIIIMLLCIVASHFGIIINN